MGRQKAAGLRLTDRDRRNPVTGLGAGTAEAGQAEAERHQEEAERLGKGG